MSVTNLWLFPCQISPPRLSSDPLRPPSSLHPFHFMSNENIWKPSFQYLIHHWLFNDIVTNSIPPISLKWLSSTILAVHSPWVQCITWTRFVNRRMVEQERWLVLAIKHFLHHRDDLRYVYCIHMNASVYTCVRTLAVDLMN